MGILDAVRALLEGATDGGRRSDRSGPLPSAQRKRAELAGLGRRGAKFRLFSTELCGAVADFDRALASGDPALVVESLPRVTRAIGLMEEFLDLAGGDLVDLLSLERARGDAFRAVATHGAGLSLCKDALAAARAGDPAGARERLAAGVALLDRFPDGVVTQPAR